MENKDEDEETPEESKAMGGNGEIVSHRTEQEADDLELELPPALQDLLRRLRGSFSSDDQAVREIPDLRKEEFGDFFRSRRHADGDSEGSSNLDVQEVDGDGRHADGDSESRTRSEVRLKVLRELGNCRTLKEFELRGVLDLGLSVAEWEALLIPMQANSALEVIGLRGIRSAETAAQIGPLLQNLVRHARKLERLLLGSFLQSAAKLAAQVAAGLRENGHCKLKDLEVSFSKIPRTYEDDFVLQVAEVISLAPELNHLCLYDVPPMDGVAKGAWSTALKSCSNLKEVEIYWAEGGIVAVLVDVYVGSSPNVILKRLKLYGLHNKEEWVTGQKLALLTSSNITVIQLSNIPLNSMRFLSVEEWRSMGLCLLQPVALRSFKMRFSLDGVPEGEWESLENGIAELWQASQRSPILRIGVLSRNPEEQRLFPFLEKAVHNTYLKHIFIRQADLSSPTFKSFAEKIALNTSVKNLTLLSCHDSEEGWIHLFLQLRENTSIKNIWLERCKGLNDDNFRALMELLQVNFTLQTVGLEDTKWEKDGKKALVEEVLQRNRKLAGYFSVFGDAQLSFGGAKAGRVFMCGSPYAGKTQLKITMMETMHKTSQSESLGIKVKEKFGKLKKICQLQRTKGVEVELLCDDELMTISIWDLAGQAIFRALQNILFPRINQACIFVFVFNPFDGQSGKRKLKGKLDETFATELTSWLRFVVSNTQITGRILPQMLIIITHKDKLKKFEKQFDLIFEDLQEIVKKLQLKFKDVVDLCPGGININDELVYHVNAKMKEEVQPITDLIVSCMKDVLTQKTPRVPKACSELVSILLKRPKEVVLEPLWPCERFNNFCSINNPLLQHFKMIDKKGKMVLHAVASYMHDVGAICMTSSTTMECEENGYGNSSKRLVVVDLNWLTQNFLGELINRFEIQNGVPKSQDDLSSISRDGFIDAQTLSSVIEKLLLQKGKQQRKVEQRMVKQLLLELDLCFNLESSKGTISYFMPILFGGVGNNSTAGRKPEWSEGTEGSCHFGFRVQCHDNERTSFSPAFYPRYQIHLRKKMAVNHGVKDESFLFSRSHVEIRVNGCYIFVEIDESTENTIDIMVKFPKHRTRDWAMEFVQKDIVKDIIQFSASEKGCPGIQLVVAVLRTKCVAHLTPRKYRTEDQAVLMERLKSELQSHIEDQLQKGKMGPDESLFECGHDWPEISPSSAEPEWSLPQEFELTKFLLPREDFDEVLTTVQTAHQDLWHNLHDLHKVSHTLDGVFYQLHVPLERSVEGMELTSEDSSIQTWMESESLLSILSGSSFKTRKDVTVGEKLILHHLEKSTHWIENSIVTGFQQVRDDLRNLKVNMDQMRSQISNVTYKVDRIIGYTKSKDDHTTPRRPYFTLEDVGKKQKMKAALSVTIPARLHLMCEARDKSHFIKGQPGLELNFEKEDRFSRSMRKLSVLSLHMIWVLLKIGVQVTAGLGSFVPDVSNLATGVSVGVSVATIDLVLDRLKQEVDGNLTLLTNSGPIDEDWYCLKDYLAQNLTSDQCAEKFNLHLVRYRDSDDPFAWLCKSCISNGKRNFLLE